MKKFLSIISLTTFILILGACEKNSNVPDISEVEKSVMEISLDYPEYNTARELVDSSDLVVSGTVENITYEMLDVRSKESKDSSTESEYIPYTIYEIKIENVYKGDVKDDIIYIKRPGGKFDHTEYILEGAPLIQEKKTYLFLVKTYEHSYPSLLNVSQASYDMNLTKTVNEEGKQDTITLSQILELFKNQK